MQWMGLGVKERGDDVLIILSLFDRQEIGIFFGICFLRSSQTTLFLLLPVAPRPIGNGTVNLTRVTKYATRNCSTHTSTSAIVLPLKTWLYEGESALALRLLKQLAVSLCSRSHVGRRSGWYQKRRHQDPPSKSSNGLKPIKFR
jgi:hypothetical protein